MTHRLTDEQLAAFNRARVRCPPGTDRYEVSTDQLVQAARRHLQVARTMSRNLRLGHYQGRNGGGGAVSGHEQDAETLLRVILDTPGATKAGSWQRALYGAVWSDHDLSVRLSENRDNGMERPELRARQTRRRRELRTLIETC